MDLAIWRSRKLIVDALDQQFNTSLSEFDNCASDGCARQAVIGLTNVLNTAPLPSHPFLTAVPTITALAPLLRLSM